MDIIVKVKTKANVDKVEKCQGSLNTYILYTREIPYKGRANQAVIKILAKHFNINEANVVIKSGLRSNLKHILLL